jgi:putative pyoverdin transport system ATP-binding/permease protein
MKLFRFIAPASDAGWLRLILVSGLSGLTNAGVLMIVTVATRSAYGTSASVYLFFVFLLTVAIYYVAQRLAFAMVASDVEDTVRRTRLRILGLVRRCELMTIEAMGETRILSAMTTEAQRLSQAMSQVTAGFQSVLVAVITGVYIAWLSRPAFVLWMFVVAVSGLIILREWSASQRLLMQAATADGAFQETSSGLLQGFKEVKLSRKRADALDLELTALAGEARAARAGAANGMSRSYVFGQVLFFLLIGSMVFLLPGLGDINVDTLKEATTAVLFVLGPVSMIVGAVPALSSAEAAAKTLSALEDALAAQVATEDGTTAPAHEVPAKPFRSLELSGVTFSYPNGERGSGFRLGPINFRIDAGETVFITGGNGTGKSTFLRLLTGLYRPQSGEIRLDGHVVQPEDMQDFRDRIAAVFADYYLFKKLYGVEADADDASALLDDMEVKGKSTINAGAFSTVALSTGQRKRLALIAAVLEGKPILVLDEWAADQDPHFRRKFYETILPPLKRRGITIVAATHDDRWFGVADHHLRLSDGRLEEQPGQEGAGDRPA